MKMEDPEELGGVMLGAWAVIYVFLLVILVIVSGALA